jgi:hypothetical protein
VDEVGPLEMNRVGGWANAVEVLLAGDYRLAVVVVRPSLVGAVRAALNASGTAQIRASVSAGPTVVAEILAMAERVH